MLENIDIDEIEKSEYVLFNGYGYQEKMSSEEFINEYLQVASLEVQTSYEELFDCVFENGGFETVLTDELIFTSLSREFRLPENIFRFLILNLLDIKFISYTLNKGI